jgi:hypothetical protein
MVDKTAPSSEGFLRIEPRWREDAVCIAGALAEQDATLEEDDGGCVVLVPDTGRGSALTSVLGALQACLDSHQILSVKVTVDEQTDVMEGSV